VRGRQSYLLCPSGRFHSERLSSHPASASVGEGWHRPGPCSRRCITQDCRDCPRCRAEKSATVILPLNFTGKHNPLSWRALGLIGGLKRKDAEYCSQEGPHGRLLCARNHRVMIYRHLKIYDRSVDENRRLTQNADSPAWPALAPARHPSGCRPALQHLSQRAGGSGPGSRGSLNPHRGSAGRRHVLSLVLHKKFFSTW